MQAVTSFFQRPMLSTLLTGAILLFIFFLFYYVPRRKLTFDFDPGGRMGEFEKHASRYQSLATLMLTICTASIAFIINFLVNLTPDIKQRNVHTLQFEQAAPRTIAYLCLSAGCCVLFLLCQNLFYEDYVHAKYTK